MLHRKQYNAIAEILHGARGEPEATQLGYVRYFLAQYFKEENPLFERQTFLKVCGEEETDNVG